MCRSPGCASDPHRHDPHLRLGRYVRFERDAVVAWLEQRRATWQHKPQVPS
jgi:hypothetical protein